MVGMEHLVGSERSLSSSSVTSFLCPPVVWTKNVSPGKEGFEEEVFLLHHQSSRAPEAWSPSDVMALDHISWPTLLNAWWREVLLGV